MAIYGKKTLNTIQEGIDNLKPFNVGNVSAFKYEKEAYVQKGWLPIEWYDRLRMDIYHNGGYVIYSFKTPIAWHNGTEWVIPDIRYSPTTTGHQGRIRVMTHNKGFYSIKH